RIDQRPREVVGEPEPDRRRRRALTHSRGGRGTRLQIDERHGGRVRETGIIYLGGGAIGRRSAGVPPGRRQQRGPPPRPARSVPSGPGRLRRAARCAARESACVKMPCPWCASCRCLTRAGATLIPAEQRKRNGNRKVTFRPRMCKRGK